MGIQDDDIPTEEPNPPRSTRNIFSAMVEHDDQMMFSDDDCSSSDEDSLE